MKNLSRHFSRAHNLTSGEQCSPYLLHWTPRACPHKCNQEKTRKFGAHQFKDLGNLWTHMDKAHDGAYDPQDIYFSWALPGSQGKQD